MQYFTYVSNCSLVLRANYAGEDSKLDRRKGAKQLSRKEAQWHEAYFAPQQHGLPQLTYGMMSQVLGEEPLHSGPEPLTPAAGAAMYKRCTSLLLLILPIGCYLGPLL